MALKTRDVPLTVRVTPEVKDALGEAAEDAQTTVSTYVHQLLTRILRQEGRIPGPPERRSKGRVSA